MHAERIPSVNNLSVKVLIAVKDVLMEDSFLCSNGFGGADVFFLPPLPLQRDLDFTITYNFDGELMKLQTVQNYNMR